MSESGLAGSATRTALTADSKRSMKRSYTLRCTRIRLRAQQSWPALSNTEPGAEAAARSRSLSSKMMFALLPPSSRVIRLTVSAAPRMIR